ncbi:hypothetical protein [Thermoflexus sp.]|uniref:hypothetical protein n=1 Tax=Thermoflexus sp. TaxID=1969742 RepID=UPI0035E43286
MYTVWYPYVVLAQSVQPTGRRRHFQSVNPWNEQPPLLVHAQELQPGHIVYFTPATFDSRSDRFQCS